MRYTVTGEWSTDRHSPAGAGTVTLQSADLLDTRNGQVYREGAYRVLVDGKAVRGKGGTVPFKGESAWSAGERLYSDLLTKAMYGR